MFSLCPPNSPLNAFLSRSSNQNNLYSCFELFYKNQKVSTFCQKVEVDHNFDKNFCDFSLFNHPFTLTDDFSLQRAPAGNEPSKENSNDKKPVFRYLGYLLKSQIKLNLSPTKKLFLSFLNHLCTGKFAQANSFAVNLSDQQMSLRCEIFSPRQVSRHLLDLAKLNIIQIKYKDKQRWISVSDISQRGRIPIITIEDDKTVLSPAQNLVLSALLDKAAFYARSGLDFITDSLQMKAVKKDLYPLSDRTVRDALQKLHQAGLISYAADCRGVLQPIVFKQALTAAYQIKFKVVPTDKCREIVHNRALRQLQISSGAAVRNKSLAESPNPQAESFCQKPGLNDAEIKNILIYQAINVLAKKDKSINELSAKKGIFPQDGSAKKDGPLYVDKHDQVEKHFVYKHAGGGVHIAMQLGNLKLNSIGRYEIGDYERDPENYFEFTCGSALEVCLNGIWVPTSFECGADGYYLTGLNRIEINGLKARRNA